MFEITSEKINNIIVKPLESMEKEKPFKYSKMFDTPYPNIFIAASKNSGKTTLINTIIEHCGVGKGKFKTKIRYFSTVGKNDKNTKKILESLEKKKLDVQEFSSLDPEDESEDGEEEKTEQSRIIAPKSVKNSKDNLLKQQFRVIKKEIRDNEEYLNKRKYDHPLYIYIFDDFSEFLQDKQLCVLLKKNRHFKTIFIVSTQNFKDLSKNARSNIDVLLIFRERGIENLQFIHKEQCAFIPWEAFLKISQKVFSEKRTFLYINCKNPEDIRENFNERFKIKIF